MRCHVCPLAWLKITKSCLSTGLAKNNKIISMLFGHFESLVFFEGGGTPYTKVVKKDVSS